MTKRTKIVYVYLALFAFALGFSFTLASQSQADGRCECCEVMCPNDLDQTMILGHIDRETYECTGFVGTCEAYCFHMTY